MTRTTRAPAPRTGPNPIPMPALPTAPPAPPRSAGRATVIVVGGLLLALAALAVHVRLYAFLCDDAFISFRYARNLASGQGLVFNPGFERVEGYSNFLWVLLLAGLDRLGISPETAALPLSWLATLGLWTTVVGVALRRFASPGREWLAIVPAVFLATNRSFAVWASSGLETRLFEWLVVASVLRLAIEVEGEVEGPPRRLLSPIGFALATLTRPDGLLIALASLATAAAYLLRCGRFRAGRLVVGLLPFVLLVGHFVFRRLYYGAWLPNTFHAKVGGRTWWGPGLDYLALFGLEYGAYLWIPLVVVGAVSLVRRGRGAEPLMFAAALVPHALFFASIGGDHFEFRPLDLELPFLALLMTAGAGALATSRWRAAVPGYVALVLALQLELPWQSHVQFPNHYLPGFPGWRSAVAERSGYLDPARDPIYRLPGLGLVARAHRELLRRLTVRFVGIRQEEHARFLATVAPEGRALRRLVERGLLPPDTYIATGSVGAIPYYSGLRTLDRLGLTDAVVARSAPQTTRIMAHDRSASLEYGRDRGVDLWAAHDVHFLWNAGALQPLELAMRGVPFYGAEVDSGVFLLVLLPQGYPKTAARFPRLGLEPGVSPEFLERYVAMSVTALRDSLRRHANDLAARRALGYTLMLAGREREALSEFDAVLGRVSDDAESRFYASVCLEAAGRREDAEAGYRRARDLALGHGDRGLADRVTYALDALRARPRTP